MTTRTRTDAGGVALLTGVVGLLVMIATAAIVATGSAGMVAAQGLQGTADATAMAVLSGSPLAGGGGAPDTVAGVEVARRGGAELVEVDVAGWPLSIVVQVRRDPDAATGPRPGGGGLELPGPDGDRRVQTARAAARLVDDP